MGKGIENARAQRENAGPLSPAKLERYVSEADKYDEALGTGVHWDPAKHAKELASLIERTGLPIEVGSPDYEVLRMEHMRGWRDLVRAVVNESRQLEVFDFAKSATRPRVGSKDRLIWALWEEFRDYGNSEQRWTARTVEAKEAHITLLVEILGANRSVRNIERDDALHVRNVLTRYPTNRNKLRETKDIAELNKVLDLPGVEKMHWRTVNKYLGTYSGLFEWAEKNGRVERSPFGGLAMKAPKVEEPPKRPFTVAELQQIKRIVLGDVTLPSDRKWPTLLAMYSGARQNEVCQLLLSDLVQREGILCIDINLRTEGDHKKQLKNAGSARVVPIHREVLEAGFLDYVEKVRSKGNGRLFPRLRHEENTGYARPVERWFNGTLKRRIGLAQDGKATFHSLRHSLTMLLRSAEVPEPRISAILGHEHETTTTAVYGGGFPMQLLKAELDKFGI